jgi:hypothetical protein
MLFILYPHLPDIFLFVKPSWVNAKELKSTLYSNYTYIC